MITVEQLESHISRIGSLNIEMVSEFLMEARIIMANTAINKYMRDAGPGAGPRNPNDNGPLRIVTTRLARSLTGGSEGRAEIEVSSTGVKLIWASLVPYAVVHEKGFTGNVQVPAHTRTITQAFGRPIAPREVTVKAHTKRMFIKARSFMGPAAEDTLPKLAEELAERYVDLILSL